MGDEKEKESCISTLYCLDIQSIDCLGYKRECLMVGSL